MGEDGRELSPPLSGGCQLGAHVSPDWGVQPEPAVSAVESSLESWLQPVRLDELPLDEDGEDRGEGDESDDESGDQLEGTPTPWPEDVGTRRQARN